MRYISTRDNYESLPFARAVDLGMVPSGGLFVPSEIPRMDFSQFVNYSYQELAQKILSPYMDDFQSDEINSCVNQAYTGENFDTPEIADMVSLSKNRHVLELWHGPTAAFKDMALQIMPHFMRYAKIKCGDKSRTMILVATSGDTGKAALEGFKNREGISIAVFYPQGGVSEIQKLQMIATEGANTHVIAVRGNFDDCQNGVKELLGDGELRKEAADSGTVFSSANSINWGRLCPQIVYYVKAYLHLVKRGSISYGQKIDFCVPTGNFGNILAGYYAKEMGLPIRKLICASNRNNVLTEFFTTDTYNSSREFHKTMSPSMDILISSNLERFLFEMSGRDAGKICGWYAALDCTGSFTVDEIVKDRMDAVIKAAWVDENEALEAIGNVYREHSYVMDTHTAVAAAAAEKAASDAPVVIVSTASPYKFSADVLKGLGAKPGGDEFESVSELSRVSSMPVHRAVDGLKGKSALHNQVIDISEMRETVRQLL